MKVSKGTVSCPLLYKQTLFFKTSTQDGAYFQKPFLRLFLNLHLTIINQQSYDHNSRDQIIILQYKIIYMILKLFDNKRSSPFFIQTLWDLERSFSNVELDPTIIDEFYNKIYILFTEFYIHHHKRRKKKNIKRNRLFQEYPRYSWSKHLYYRVNFAIL